MADLAPGDEFAGCRIEAVAGRGGMGVVYRATQLALGRPVALKLLAGDRAGEAGFRERFQRESRMAAAIDHPNVIPVYAAGEDDGRLYLVMRYVAGTDLQALLRTGGALDPEDAADVVAQVASALDAAHAAGLVHRDVKPANVLLGAGHAWLSDFGLTRLVGADTEITESGQWIGTVDYCSPEQLRGDTIDARADVYSLGCVLYAALTGCAPLHRGTVPATLAAQLNDPPPRPSGHGVPVEFDRVIARALAKDPDDRYPSAGDLGRAALAAARGERVTESERSVARGPAAPDAATRVVDEDEPLTAVTRFDGASEAASGAQREAGMATAYATSATRVAGEEDGPAGVLPPPWERGDRRPHEHDDGPDDPADAAGATAPPPSPDRRVYRPVRVLRSAAVALGLVALGLVVSAVLGDGATRTASGPLSASEVSGAAEAFAAAYRDEDPAALRRTLARRVLRVLPSGVARGRDAVVAQYARQFDGNVNDYRLTDLQARGGTAGRASGAYTVEREGEPPIQGRVVFGVVRERGHARIALITATPTS